MRHPLHRSPIPLSISQHPREVRARVKMPTPARLAAEAISSRFAHGRPSNDPDLAGVFIHVWDQLEDPKAPWQPCLRDNCKRFERGRLDRLPSSLVYRRMPNRGKNESIPMFSDGLRGGLILRPTAAQIRCAYPADGHSRWNADGCACPFVGDVAKGIRRADDCSRWCEDPSKSADEPNARGYNRNVKELRCGSRPWRPQDMAAMLTRAGAVGMNVRAPWGGLGRESWTGSENNEVVVSASVWNASAESQLADWRVALPRMIAAFWIPHSITGPCCNHETPFRCAPHCGERERQVRNDYLRQFGLSEADGPPLLELRRDRWHDPFHILAPKGGGGGGGGGRGMNIAGA